MREKERKGGGGGGGGRGRKRERKKKGEGAPEGGRERGLIVGLTSSWRGAHSTPTRSYVVMTTSYSASLAMEGREKRETDR